MENKINYAFVGLFVLILSAVIVVTALWLGYGLNQESYTTYLVYMDESVSGLALDAPVKYNGVDVGYVSDLELNKNNPQQVILTLKLYSDTPINQTTQAVLMQQGLTGIAFIGLQGGNNAKPLMKLPNEPYPIIHSTPSFFVRLDQSLQALTTNVNSLSNNLQSLLDKKNLQNIQTTLQNLSQFSETLADNNQRINQTMESLTVFSNNAATISKQFPQLMSTFQKSANQFNTATANFNSAAISTKNTVNSFSDQLMPQTYQILQSANTVTSNLQGLSAQLNQNPGVLVSGTTSPRPGPGE